MNIGILSMQKIHNYGSFLQALSLKLQLEKRGHNVYFIDILCGRKIIEDIKQVRPSIISKLDRYALKRIENYCLSKRMDKIHINDYKTYLQTEKTLSENEEYDLVIIGSDEVFNATASSPWGFTTQLFGDVPNAKKVVTYAASCGQTTYHSAEKYGIVDELCEAMSHLDSISVRDSNTFDFVSKVTGKTPIINLDPVFITNFDEFITKPIKRKPYMLVYAYGNRICDKKEVAVIKEYAREKGLDIISVGTQQRWCKHNIAANAFELLSYVKSAECIVTDTFHGTVFSAKYNKRFVSLIRESNENKLSDLLYRLKLESRAVKNLECFKQTLDSDIDFDALNRIIDEWTKSAYSYLDTITK